MTMQFKAFLYEGKPSKCKEIRRFTIDEDVCTSYEYLKNKVTSIFPKLGENFSLQWRDSDEDLIWFNSDEELLQALSQHSPGDVFKIFVKVKTFTEKDKCPEGSRPDFSQWQESFGQFNPSNFSSRFPHTWGGGFFSGGAPNMNRWGCPMQNRSDFGRNQDSSRPSHNQPPSGQKQQSSPPQQPQPSPNQQDPGKDYLKTMGNAVADILHPFGIDVDVQIEHNGERSKCTGEQQSPKPPTSQPTTPPAQQSTSSGHTNESQPDKEDQGNSSDPEWTFVKTDGNRAPPTDNGNSYADVAMETEEEGRQRRALDQLVAMGFKPGEWLNNLLKACDYDINLALDSMRPGRGDKA